MNLTQILILVLVFLSVTLLVGGLFVLFTPGAVSQRLGKMEPTLSGQTAGEDVWQTRVVKILGPVASLATPKEGWEHSPLRQHFMNAGWRGENVAPIFFGAKAMLTFILPGITLLAMEIAGVPMKDRQLMIVVLGMAAAGYYLPSAILTRRAFTRKRDVFEGLPDAVDLMMVCLEAGLGLDAAISRVAQEIRLKSPELADELYLVGLELRAGSSRERALRNMALRTGVEEMDELVTMLIQCDRFGASIADSLRVQADTLRTKRRQRAEEEAAKTPVKLLFPLIFFIFPALLLVLMGPAIIGIYRVLVPVMTGG